jgi:hypothetical protein
VMVFQEELWRGIEQHGIHEVSVEIPPTYRVENAHLSSFINRFFSLSSSLALTGRKEDAKHRLSSVELRIKGTTR